MIELTPDQRRYLKSLAHHLDPVVMIGNNGLTDAVIREIAINLDAHELIKIRVLGDDRTAREAIYQSLADQLNAAPIQHIGKLLVVWRPKVEVKVDKSGKATGRRKAPRQLKRSFQNN